jgi:hypothetical protein
MDSIISLRIEGKRVPLDIEQGRWILARAPELGRDVAQARQYGGRVIVIDEDLVEEARKRFGL